jgi:hypothetical protein
LQWPNREELSLNFWQSSASSCHESLPLSK